MNPENGKDFATTIKGVVIKEYKVSEGDVKDAPWDGVLIKLDKKVPSEIAVGIKGGGFKKENCVSILAAGYSVEFDHDRKNIRGSDGCEINMEATGRVGFQLKGSCPVTNGNSGSPVICHEESDPNDVPWMFGFVYGVAHKGDSNHTAPTEGYWLTPEVGDDLKAFGCE